MNRAMLKAEAETQIVAEWSRYIAENPIPHPTTISALSFYAHLQKNCPHLIQFRCHGDKWQVVKGWLLRRGLVTDRL